jgi:hypothetical protein
MADLKNIEQYLSSGQRYPCMSGKVEFYILWQKKAKERSILC